MAGNVVEWTSTKYDHGMFQTKGGGFYLEPIAMAEPDWLDFRTEQLQPHDPKMDAIDLGFRCARDENTAAGATRDVEVVFPPKGSTEREALLGVLRARLKTTSEFKVNHLALAGDWAYFEGRKITDKALVAALFGRKDGKWEVSELFAGAAADQAVPVPFKEKLATGGARSLPPALVTPKTKGSAQ